MRLIHVTLHSVQRAHERWPDTLPADREQLRNVLAREVTAALDEGRYASRRPAFAVAPGRKRTKGRRNGGERDRTLRFAWTPAGERVYLVDRRGDTINVVTCFRPDEAITSAT